MGAPTTMADWDLWIVLSVDGKGNDGYGTGNGELEANVGLSRRPVAGAPRLGIGGLGRELDAPLT